MVSDLELVTFGELVDRLSIINIKLFNLLDKTAELDKIENKSKKDIDLIVKLSGDNIRLATQRSCLKSAIDKKLNIAIKKGGSEILDEVKSYK